MRFVLLIASVLCMGYAKSVDIVCDDDLCSQASDLAQNSPQIPAQQQIKPHKKQPHKKQSHKKHAWYLGASIFSGDGVLLEKDFSNNSSKIFRVKDGGIVGLVGGLYRIAPRHTLHYGLQIGYASIAFDDARDSRLFGLNGAKGGVELGYEWNFYMRDHFSWSAVFGAEYIACYYKKNENLLVLQEIMPRVGVGFEGRRRYYFEAFFGVPVYASLWVKNTSYDFSISHFPKHLRLGFLSTYRF